jgi:hypothetical protein
VGSGDLRVKRAGEFEHERRDHQHHERNALHQDVANPVIASGWPRLAKTMQRISVRSDSPPERQSSPIERPRASHVNPWVDAASIVSDMVIFIECVIRFDRQ